HTVTVALAEPGEPGPAAAPLAVLDAVVLTGPIGVELPPGPGRASIFTCDPASGSPPIGEAACAEEIIRAFGRRAWRRPLADDEVDRVLGLYGTAFGAGSAWDESVMLALKGILLAPWFVYRIEVDPDPESTVPRPLDGYELASRLSYFLWSTMPDEELLVLAGSGLLVDPEILRTQVARMLRDPKAGSLVETLGAEWLYLTVVDESSPDPELFPAFDDALRASMKEELMLFAGSILLGDRSMMDLVDGTETWIDARLASHYGVAPPATAGFALVDLAERPGIVSRAGWLTALSHPTRTSPVRRGKWVVENLMCEPPPPVPDNVDQLLEGDEDPAVTTSVRDQLEQHRAPSACAQCHVVMDGIGFGLENYDAIGRYRTEDAFGNPLDTTGALVSGATFDDAAGLGAALAADPKTARCMVQKVFTFALGRAPRVEDLDLLSGITDTFEGEGHRFSTLATEIVLSDAFRYRTPAEVAR
ncbi:MAG: DUF1592 domain-containing protein, partial [Deltaproteobacteria bacterium]|nr:DUF1592 domain-containing protein [Deltaproteobacteria bacterium]